jgi:hypothetical protein
MSNFKLAVKSTLDKIMKDVADSLSISFFDLDGVALVSDVFESEASALAWSLLTFHDAPVPPMYFIEFESGGKTSNDISQYISMSIVDAISDKFCSGKSYDIMDYSGQSQPTKVLGNMYISGCGVAPAQTDRGSGLRLVRIQAHLTEWL